MLQHHAARSDADAPRAGQQPGDHQFRRGTGEFGGIVVLSHPEAVKAPPLGGLRQRQRALQRLMGGFAFGDRALVEQAQSVAHGEGLTDG